LGTHDGPIRLLALSPFTHYLKIEGWGHPLSDGIAPQGIDDLTP
jgi:hypothetical protein